MIKINGRRGAFLFLFGSMYVIMAYAVTLPNPTPYVFLHDLVPLWLRSLVWGIPGIIACFCAFREAPRDTVIGYTALSFPLGWRIVSYSLSWVVLPVEFRTSILGLLVYAILLTSVLIVASWPEPRGLENEVKLKAR